MKKERDEILKEMAKYFAVREAEVLISRVNILLDKDHTNILRSVRKEILNEVIKTIKADIK